MLAAVFSNEVMSAISRSLNISESFGFAVGIFLTSITILLTDLIPKNIATIHGDQLFKSTLWITNIIYYIFYFPVIFLSKVADTVAHWIGGLKKHLLQLPLKKRLSFSLTTLMKKVSWSAIKRPCLKVSFELGTTPIKEIMVPETSIISINVNSTQKETLDLFSKYQFTRLPVYEDKTDNIIGMVHQKDFFQLLSRSEDKPLRDIVRPIMFVPESAKGTARS